MRIRLRETMRPKAPPMSPSRQLANRLKSALADRTKKTEDLKSLSGDMMNMQQLQQAGMLAHYAVMMAVFGSMLKAAQKAYIKKQLEKLGTERDIQDKLDGLNAINKNSKELAEYAKSIDSLSEDEKALRQPHFESLLDARKAICMEKIGLSELETNAVLNEFDKHYSSSKENMSLENGIKSSTTQSKSKIQIK